jgi:hypothetical protein
MRRHAPITSAGVRSLLGIERTSVTGHRRTAVRTLAITQNVTVDGAIGMFGDWFEPQGDAEVDTSELLAEVHRQDSRADALVVGRRTFEDMRG